MRLRQPEGTEYRAFHLRSTEKTFKTKRNGASARIKICVLWTERGNWTKLNGFTWASRPILPLFKTCSESKWTHVIFKQIAPLEWTSHCQGEIVGRYYYVLNSPFHPFDNPSYTIALWWTIERLSWALWALGSGLMTVLQEGIYVFKQAPCPSVRTARQKNALVFKQ